jgi:dihydroorotase
MSTLLIRNGRVIDPARYLDEVRDVWIVDGRFAPQGVQPARADETLDATGLLVMPGLVDVHVHLREPGNEAAETLETGCAAALAGGYTSIVCMPNTTPALDTPERLRAVLTQAAALRGPHVCALAAITVGRQGKALVDFAALKDAGALGFTDDGNGVQDADLVRSAMEQCAALGERIAEHCEVVSRAAGGVMHLGAASERAKLPGIPAEAESEMVERDVLLCEQTGAALHLQHISGALSMNVLRDARARGADVTAEVTPHHLVLTDEHAADGGPDFKMNPPLRSERDRRELLRGVSDGILGIIATDHAPHTKEAKAAGFRTAPFGVIGMETAAAVIWTHLVLEGFLSPEQMVERMSTAPAEAFGLKAGTMRPGRPGDVTLFNPSATWTVNPESFRSRSRNCPFAGQRLQGRVAATVVDGEVRYHDAVR